MKKAEEYREHAAECRRLAAQMASGEQREALEEMARTWDQLAEDRAERAGGHDEPDGAADTPEP